MLDSSVLVPIMGMSIPIVLVPTILGLRHARLERQMEHAERMRALELGRTLPGDEPWWSPGRIVVAIGAFVPVGVFFFAWMASTSANFEAPIWFAATVVGVSAVICGSLLAHRHLLQREAASHYARASAKPAFDPNDYDMCAMEH